MACLCRITREHRESLAKTAHAFGTTAKNNLAHISTKHEKIAKNLKDVGKDRKFQIHEAVSAKLLLQQRPSLHVYVHKMY